jgi:hypothetical protein
LEWVIVEERRGTEESKALNTRPGARVCHVIKPRVELNKKLPVGHLLHHALRSMMLR